MTPSEPVPPKAPEKSETAKREEEVMAFWREHKTFQRTLEKNAPQGEFVFYDGPPFATGLPHHGSLLSSIIKDVIPRYKTMRGFRVRRRWGWDTHGLPIESLVEKELGLATKKDILEIGIAAFNEKARSMVLAFVHDWERYVERVGRWVDFKNSYKTMDNTYIESVWWALKQLWEKKLLYEGRKVLMYCTHCETPLAKAEIAMDNTYKDVTEEAVTVRFKVRRPSQYGLPDNTFFLAWTTTPWTLPGNVALAVGPEIDYVLVPEEGGMVIIAASRLDIWRGSARPKVMVDMGKSYKGKDLIGIEYEPLFEVPSIVNAPGKKHIVIAADFVGENEGTGIVHTAVMYGEDDFQVGQKELLPMVQILEANGTYNLEAPEFLRGKYIKEAERDIKRDLENRHLLFDRKNNTHSYPHCYRCGTPLIYNAVSSWFINIQEVKGRMVEENEKVNWVPGHLKHGRFGNIVASAPDWTISRNRFWASPLPIWKEKNGTAVLVVDSLDELKKRVKSSGNQYLVMRHGEARSNVEGFIDGNPHSNNSLTETGKATIAKNAKALKGKGIEKIYVSPFLRTKESAEIVREALGLPESAVIVEERLREVNPGVFDQKPVVEFRSFFSSWAERFTKAPLGGTDYSVMRRRLGEFLLEIDAAQNGKTVLLITHESPAAILSMIARGETPSDAEKRFSSDETVRTGEVITLPFVTLPWNADFELDLHRPYIDSLVLYDDAGKEYERIPEVVDCWVESGAMPFAEYHYPFENKDEFEKRAPGDFIAEYIAQTRTWFYYMHALGVLLFDRLAFKNVVSTGTILAADGQKISKSKRNYTDPLELIDRYGADAMRFYLMSSPVMQSEDVRFRDEDVRDAHNRVIGMLWNTYKFFELYKKEYRGGRAWSSTHVLDRWVLARLNQLVREVTTAFDAYDTPLACRLLRSFIEEYSTWYVRRSRERMKEEGSDKQQALATQRECLLVVARLLAPITPFLAESVYRGVGGKEESVHMDLWPSEHHGFLARLFGSRDGRLLSHMAHTRALVSRSLEARDKAGIRVRQPLARLEIRNDVSVPREFLDIIKDEVNVKEVVSAPIADEVRLDTAISPALKEEGDVRELVRMVQDARKKAGLTQGDRANVIVSGDALVGALVNTHGTEIADATQSEVSYQIGESLSVEIHR